MNDLIKPKEVGLAITKFCHIIGIIPSTYKLALTYEEQIMEIGHYLEDTVYPAINDNAQALEELQTLFTELKDYVDNYFDNLDVQEEINNKLDDMAEAGTLEEIISTYLNSQAVFGYNTVNDMLNAENLINGSYARTLGYYSKNDGGSSLYKIRNKTDDDIIDMGSILQMNNNTLVAECIFNNEVNVKKFGCYGDNLHNDTTQLQRAINFAISNNKTLKLDRGTFLNNGINITGTINFEGFGEKSILKLISSSDINGAIVITNDGFTNSHFKNFVIECNNSINANGIYSRPTIFKANNELIIENIKIYNANKNGIDIFPDNEVHNIGTQLKEITIAGCNENGINIKGTDLILANIICFSNEKAGINAVAYSTKFEVIKCYQNGKGDYTTLEDSSRIDQTANGTYYKKYPGLNLTAYGSTFSQIDMQENAGDGITATGYNNIFTCLNLDNNGFLNLENNPFTPVSYESQNLIPIYDGIYFKNHNMIKLDCICANMHYTSIGAQQRGAVYLNNSQFAEISIKGGQQYQNTNYRYESQYNAVVNDNNTMKGTDLDLSTLTLPENYSLATGSYIRKIGNQKYYHLIIKKSTGNITDGETITGINSEYRPSANAFGMMMGSDNNGWSGYTTVRYQLLINGSIILKSPTGNTNFCILDQLFQ